MRIIKIIENYPKTTIVCLAFALMLPSLGNLLVSIMEARNFITAREMLNEGNWLLTTLNGSPRYEKPPLPTFITAVFGSVFGIQNIFWLRFPAVIMVSLIGVYTYLVSLKFINKQHSLINGLIAVTSFYVLAICIEAPWDIYTHAFMLIAIFHLLSAYEFKQTKNLLFATLFIAFSVLSKGPISLYALLLPFLLAYAIVFGLRNKFVLKTTIPLLIGILLGGIWFMYVRMVDPEVFIKIATKETSNWSSYEVKPFYYYWSFFIQSGLWTIPAFVSLLFPYLRNRVINKNAYKLSFLWTIFAVILLSVIPEKKSRYLMPVLIPLAFNTGFYIEYLIRQFKELKHKAETIPGYLNFSIIGLGGVIGPAAGYFLYHENIKSYLGLYVFASLLLLIIGSAILVNLVRKNMLHVFYTSILLFASLMFSIAPIMVQFQNNNEVWAPISNLKDESKEQNINVYLLDEISPEMLWDYGTTIPLIDKTGGKYNFPSENKFGLLVNDKENIEKSGIDKFYTLEEKETFNRNTATQGSRRHKVRNINYYYILTKKNAKD